MRVKVCRCSPSVLGLSQNGFGFLQKKRGGNRAKERQKDQPAIEDILP